VDLAKIQVICDWSALKTLNELCNFLGLAKFYRRFVLGLSHIIRALSQVTKGGAKAKFVWATTQHKEFKDLKFFLCSTPILILTGLQQSFDIEIYASYYAITTVLTQHGNPMAYHSETLSDDVCRYPTYDK
jgi:hypothetical protein